MITPTTQPHASDDTAWPLRVLHVMPGAWMPLTQSWLYHQITRLPTTTTSHVVCDSISDLDRFPFDRDHLHPAAGRTLAQRLVDRLRDGSPQAQRGSSHLTRVMRAVQPQVVHSHFGHVACRNQPVCGSFGVPHVATFYGIDVNQLPRQGWRGRYEQLFASVDLVLCEGPHMAAAIESLGCDPARIAVHHLGVCTEQIAHRPMTWDGAPPLRVLMAASFREKKNIPGAVRAVAAVRDRLGIEVRLTLIGDAGDTDAGQLERARIARALSETGMTPVTRQLGFQPHATILEEAAHHHLFLHPSITARSGDTEGGAPIVLLDMLAAGLPVVSSTHCDIPHMITDGVHGYLAREHDHDDLVATIIRAVEDRNNWRAISGAGRARVERDFDASNQAARLAGFYHDLADRGTIPPTLSFEHTSTSPVDAALRCAA